jgi:hypothetical protein
MLEYIFNGILRVSEEPRFGDVLRVLEIREPSGTVIGSLVPGYPLTCSRYAVSTLH